MCFMLLSLYDGSSGKSGQNAGLPYCLTVVFVVTSAHFSRKPPAFRIASGAGLLTLRLHMRGLPGCCAGGLKCALG